MASHRPDQLDYINYVGALAFSICLAILAAIPKVCPSYHLDLDSRFEWLTLFIYGCLFLVYIMVEMCLDSNRDHTGVAEIPLARLLRDFVMNLPETLGWILVTYSTTILGTYMIYFYQPDWLPYLKEVDDDFADGVSLMKKLEEGQGDDQGDMKHEYRPFNSAFLTFILAHKIIQSSYLTTLYSRLHEFKDPIRNHIWILISMTLAEYQRHHRIQAQKAFKQFFTHIDKVSAYIYIILHFFLVVRAALFSDHTTWTAHNLVRIFLQELAWDFWVFLVILYAVRWIFRYDDNWWYPEWWVWYLNDLQGGMKGVWRDISMLHNDLRMGLPVVDARSRGVTGWMRRNL
ncbi:MAG: hypothetical protein Q9168_006625 [Polycauliona sp. 1 TL-2023]